MRILVIGYLSDTYIIYIVYTYAKLGGASDIDLGTCSL